MSISIDTFSDDYWTSPAQRLRQVVKGGGLSLRSEGGVISTAAEDRPSAS
ncbi:MAG TPA: hypothetical protein VF089_00235 [Candidatus Binatia bacterium]